MLRVGGTSADKVARTPGGMMDRKDWLLMAVGDGIQPIQLQKLLFKFRMETKVPRKETYAFKPYNWGPYSHDIFVDLEKLCEVGVVEAVPTGRGWNVYHLTDQGVKERAELRRIAPAPFEKKLHAIREWVTSRGFEELLQDVYDQYPKYATQTLFVRK